MKVKNITIYNAKGVAKAAVKIGQGSIRHRELGGDDYIKLRFTLPTPMLFSLGDYAMWQGEKFVCTSLKKPTLDDRTNSYKYELQLDAWYMQWAHRIFKLAPATGAREASWTYTGTLEGHLNLFLQNLTHEGFYANGASSSGATDIQVNIHSAQIEEVEAAKALTYNDTNLIDALTAMAGDNGWKCEWWIEDNTIHFGKLDKGTAVDFEIGENLSSMSASASDNNYATRVYAFGSTRNIPASYNKTLVFYSGAAGQNITDPNKPLKAEYFRSSAYDGGSRYANIASPSLDRTATGATNGTVEASYLVLARALSAGTYRITPASSLITYAVSGSGAIDSLAVNISVLVNYADHASAEYTLNSQVLSDIVIGDGVYEAIPLYAVSLNLKQSAQTIYLKISLTPTPNEAATQNFTLSVKTQGAIDIQKQNTTINNVQVSIVSVIDFAIVLGGGTSKTATFDTATGTLTLNSGSVAAGQSYVINNLYKSAVPTTWYESAYDNLVVAGIVEERLMLPATSGGCVDAEDNLSSNPERIVESVAVFDDIYPKRESTITGVEEITIYDKIEQADGSYERVPATAYRVKSAEQDFDRDYILPGETLGIRFLTGALAGMEFDAQFIPSGTGGEQWFEVVRNETYGRMLPDDVLFPETGDKYALFNFDIEYVGDSYVASAEQELLAAAEKYVAESKIDPNTYDCTLLSRVAHTALSSYDNTNIMSIYDLGQKINLINAAFFETGSRMSRVIGYEYKLDKPYDAPVFTVGEAAKYSRIGDLSAQVESLVYNGKQFIPTGATGSASAVYVIGSNDATAWSDSNVLSAKRTLNDFISKLRDEATQYGLQVGGNLSAGKNLSATGNLSVNGASYLRSIVDILGVLTTHQRADMQAIRANSLHSYDFASGDAMEGGKGFGVEERDDRSYLEVDNLLVRMKAVFAELEIRKLSAVGGNIILSAAASTLSSVEGVGPTYKCYINADDGTMATTNGWVVGDIVRCQTFNIAEGVYQNVSNKNYYAYVSNIGQDTSGKWIEVEQVLIAGSVGSPAAGDVIVQMGTTDSTRLAERGNIIVLTTTGTNSPSILQYSGVNTYVLGSNQLVTQISPEGNIFRAKSFEFQTSGGTTPISRYCGAYNSSLAYSYYDQVTYNGSLWNCKYASGCPAGNPPSTSSTYWEQVVAKGADGANGGTYSCFFETPSIVVPATQQGQIPQGYSVEVPYHVYYGSSEVTQSFTPSVVSCSGASYMLNQSLGVLILGTFTGDGSCEIVLRTAGSAIELRAKVVFTVIPGGVDGQDGADAYSCTLSRSSAVVGASYNSADYEKITIVPYLNYGGQTIDPSNLTISHNASSQYCTIVQSNGVLTIQSITALGLQQGYSFNISVTYGSFQAVLPFRYEVVNVGFKTTGGGTGMSMYAEYVDSNGTAQRAEIGTLVEQSGTTFVKLAAQQIDLRGYTTINEHFKIDNNGNLTAVNARISGTITEGSTVIESSLQTSFKKIYYDEDEQKAATDSTNAFDTTDPLEPVMLISSDYFLYVSSEFLRETIKLPMGVDQIGKSVVLVSTKPKLEESFQDVTPVTEVRPNQFIAVPAIYGDNPETGIIGFDFKYGMVELLAVPNMWDSNYCLWVVRSKRVGYYVEINH